MSQSPRNAQAGLLTVSVVVTVLGLLLLTAIAPQATGAIRAATLAVGLLTELFGVGMLGMLYARSRNGHRS